MNEIVDTVILTLILFTPIFVLEFLYQYFRWKERKCLERLGR